MSRENAAWLWVCAAGLMEVAWALGLKASDGFRRPVVSALTVAGSTNTGTESPKACATPP